MNLFDSFLCVAQKDPNDPFSLEPVVTQVFHAESKSGEQSHDNDDILERVKLFCFPEPKQMTCDHGIVGPTFSFVLTKNTGSRVFGFVQTIAVNRLTCEAWCFLSQNPYFSLFAQLFRNVLAIREHSEDGWNVVWELLSSVLKRPFPFPGEKFSVSVRGATFSFTRPDDDDMPLVDVDHSPLLTSFSPGTLLQLFAALLNERRLILVSDSLATLSSCAVALTALLYPFSWHHIFVPVLPHGLLDMCDAPMPFILGVKKSYFREIRERHLGDVVVTDLDRGKLEFWCTDKQSGIIMDVTKLPQPATSVLSRSISRLWSRDKSPVRPGRDSPKTPESVATQQRLLSVFRKFFVTIFGSYPHYVRRKDDKSYELDVEGFIEGASKVGSGSDSARTKDFLQRFCQTTQLFEVFAREREAMASLDEPPKRIFEREVLENVIVSNDKTWVEKAAKKSSYWLTAVTNSLEKTGHFGKERMKQFKDVIGGRLTDKISNLRKQAVKEEKGEEKEKEVINDVNLLDDSGNGNVSALIDFGEEEEEQKDIDLLGLNIEPSGNEQSGSVDNWMVESEGSIPGKEEEKYNLNDPFFDQHGAENPISSGVDLAWAIEKVQPTTETEKNLLDQTNELDFSWTIEPIEEGEKKGTDFLELPKTHQIGTGFSDIHTYYSQRYSEDGLGPDGRPGSVNLLD